MENQKKFDYSIEKKQQEQKAHIERSLEVMMPTIVNNLMYGKTVELSKSRGGVKCNVFKKIHLCFNFKTGGVNYEK